MCGDLGARHSVNEQNLPLTSVVAKVGNRLVG